MSVRVGKAVEALVGASIVLVSERELNVATSLVDDEASTLCSTVQERATRLLFK